MGLFRRRQDRCGDCTLASISHRRYSLYLEPYEMLAIAREGAALDCKEAWPGRAWL
jgi:FO synthase